MVVLNWSLLENVLKVFECSSYLVLIVVDNAVAQLVTHVLECGNVGLNSSMKVNAEAILINVILPNRLTLHLEICKQFQFASIQLTLTSLSHLLNLSATFSFAALG